MKEVRLTGGIHLIDSSVKLKFKKLSPEAVAPAYSRAGDCGLDLTAISMTENALYIEYDTGLAIEVPAGFVGLIYPRSSLSNYHLVLSNHVGVIDQNYRGAIKFRFKKTSDKPSANYYKVGDRVGQLIITPCPVVELEEVAELIETNRGTSGFGSSGK